MDFLQELFTLTPGDIGSKHGSFALDVMNVRPCFDEILGFKEIAADLKLKMIAAVARSKSALVSIDLVMDSVGMIAVFTFSALVPSGPAKLTVDTIIQAFPKQQRDTMLLTFRPLDELDKFRFDAMQTVRSLRPCVPKAEAESEEESDEIFYLPGERRLDPKFSSVEAYCLALAEEERIAKAALVEETWQPTLALTDNASVSGTTLAVQRAKADWVEMAQKLAAISILSIGSGKLTYIRCHREARRVALLERERDSYCSLVGLVKVAMQHCDSGTLPDPSQSRVLKAEFLKRCIAVLKSTHPAAECDVKKLPLKDQRNIIVALGGASGCEDCPEPAEWYFHWDHHLLCWSRQSHLASAPTSKLPETLALCKKCFEKNPWSCTSCRRRDTFAACRGTRPIPNGISLHGDCKVHYHVDCNCGGTFRQHTFRMCDEPTAEAGSFIRTLPLNLQINWDWMEQEEETLRKDEGLPAKRRRLS